MIIRLDNLESFSEKGAKHKNYRCEKVLPVNHFGGGKFWKMFLNERYYISAKHIICGRTKRALLEMRTIVQFRAHLSLLLVSRATGTRTLSPIEARTYFDARQDSPQHCSSPFELTRCGFSDISGEYLSLSGNSSCCTIDNSCLCHVRYWGA